MYFYLPALPLEQRVCKIVSHLFLVQNPCKTLQTGPELPLGASDITDLTNVVTITIIHSYLAFTMCSVF